MRSPLSVVAEMAGFFSRPSVSKLAKLEAEIEAIDGKKGEAKEQYDARIAELDAEKDALLGKRGELVEALRSDIQFEQILPDKKSKGLHTQLHTNEAVHPTETVEELVEMRVGGIGANKRCFARVIENGKPEVTAGIFTALVKVPNTDGHMNYDSIPGDIAAIRDMEVEEFSPPQESEDQTVVAVLYTISSNSKHNLEKSGRLLASDVYGYLHSEAQEKGYSLLISTLSPIRGFSKWLADQEGFENYFDKDANPKQPKPTEEFMGFIQDPANQDIVKHMMMRYLLEDKEGGKPRDPVMNFHLGNGAYIGDLKFNTDNGQDWVMVNYVYDSDPRNVQANQELYDAAKMRRIAPHLREHLQNQPTLLRQADVVFDTSHAYVPEGRKAEVQHQPEA